MTSKSKPKLMRVIRTARHGGEPRKSIKFLVYLIDYKKFNVCSV